VALYLGKELLYPRRLATNCVLKLAPHDLGPPSAHNQRVIVSMTQHPKLPGVERREVSDVRLRDLRFSAAQVGVQNGARDECGSGAQAPIVGGYGRVKSDFHGEVSDTRRSKMKDQGNLAAIDSSTKDVPGLKIGPGSSNGRMIGTMVVMPEGSASRNCPRASHSGVKYGRSSVLPLRRGHVDAMLFKLAVDGRLADTQKFCGSNSIAARGL